MKDLKRLLGLLESMDFEIPPSELGGALLGPLAPLEGALLAGRYRVRSLVGVGGMGRVLLADDEQVGRLVTLKMLLEEPTEAALERLRREAIVAARLSHPNVVRVHDLVETAGHVFFVGEYVEDARPLDEAWEGLPRAARLELLLQVADGLAAAHAAGVVHRDVKPENVLVDATNRARVCDFGIAAGQGLERLTQTGAVIGSPTTMAPEQARGERVDVRADVWSLGVLLYLALYDELPFAGESVAEILVRIGQSEPDYPRKLNVPRALRGVCVRALRKDPARRHRDAGAFASALRAGLHAKPVPWPLLAGALLTLCLAWLWGAGSASAPAPLTARASTTPSASAPPRAQASAPHADSGARIRLDEPPRRMALTEDLLCVETSRGLELWDLDSQQRREVLEGQRLGQEGAPRLLVVPAPRRLLVPRGQPRASFAGDRLELLDAGRSLLLPLPPRLPAGFQELVLTPTSVVLVCGAERNGCKVLAWHRSSGQPLALAGGDESYVTPRSVAPSPSGSRLAVGGTGGLVVVFHLDRPDQPPLILKDPKLGSFAPRAHESDRGVTGLSFPSESELLSANGLSLALWELPSGVLRDRVRIPCHELASREGRVAIGGREEVLVQPWGRPLPTRLR